MADLVRPMQDVDSAGSNVFRGQLMTKAYETGVLINVDQT